MSVMAESTTAAASSPNTEVTQKKQKNGGKSCQVGNHGVSEVWNYFNKHLVEGTKKFSGKADCKFCNIEIDAPSGGGTNKLWSHINKCKSFSGFQEDNKTQSLLSFGGGQASSWVFNQERCRKSLAKMIVLDELPFCIVDKEGLRLFCADLQPKFHVVCRATITTDCIKMFFEEKKNLKEYLKALPSRVCITTDMWTSIQNLGYMVLTTHFVDNDWNLNKKIINFRVIPHPHRGEVIAKAVENCLLDWDLKKITTITLDNAKNNDSCVTSLVTKLNKRDALLLEGDFFHVRCFAHVINFVVRDGIEDVQETIKCLRRCVKYIRSSPSRLQEFKQCVVDEKLTCKKSLCLDVKTRWNSTYLMIDVALQFERAFDSFKEQNTLFAFECTLNGDMSLDSEGWKKLKTLHTFLEEFYELTKRVSGSKYATSNTYFDELTQVKDLLMENLTSSDEDVRKIAHKMDVKFDKYCNFKSLNLILVVAMVLNPRYKMQYIEFWYLEHLKKNAKVVGEEQTQEIEYHQSQEVEDFVGKLKDVMYRLYSHYKLETSNMDIDPPRTQDENVANHVGNVSKRPKAKDLFRGSLKRKEHGEGLNDMEKYLADDVVEDEIHFNVLAWWREKVGTYRVVSMVARDVLSIPVTSVASECAFSTAGRVLDPFRSSLAPTIVECLVCTQDWLRSPRPSIGVEEKLEFLEEIEKVMLEEMKALELGSSS